jgi:hypothetical protein
MRLALIARASRRGRAGLGVNVATRQPLKRLCSNFDPLFLDLLDLPIPRCQPPLIFNPAPNVIDYAGDDDKDEPGRPCDQQDIVECHR